MSESQIPPDGDTKSSQAVFQETDRNRDQDNRRVDDGTPTDDATVSVDEQNLLRNVKTWYKIRRVLFSIAEQSLSEKKANYTQNNDWIANLLNGHVDQNPHYTSQGSDPIKK